MTIRTLDPELLHRMDDYWRAANYLSVGRLDPNPTVNSTPRNPSAVGAPPTLCRAGQTALSSTPTDETVGSVPWSS